uniref:poly(A)-specific ribonuclease n=1 Tax=Timema tahoe TaxID=61484 RepID=A0A7R9IKC7_9NEOP|nr:unnamed protein product [Timema tahoe]
MFPILVNILRRDGAHSPSAPMDTLDPAQQDQAHLPNDLRSTDASPPLHPVKTCVDGGGGAYKDVSLVMFGLLGMGRLTQELQLGLNRKKKVQCYIQKQKYRHSDVLRLVAPSGTGCCTNVVAGIFTVMCYNVLCDKYATRQMYGYCPSWALTWEYRKKGILDEIRHYSADIISLQEVETSQFYNFFLPELKRDGYDGIFSPKSRAKTMAENERKYVDGCAIFYRTAKFSLIKEHLVEFNQLAMANAEGSDHMLNRVMPKDNIGLAALLKTKEAAWDNGLPPDVSQVHQPLLVCTAHIHWDPEFCDVKLIQTMMLSNELRGILEDASQSFRPGHKPDTSGIQLLLCGDFNSLPDSGVIEFLTSGRVPADHKDFKALTYKSSLQKISGCDKANEFIHSFKLASAYSEDIMPFTNYTFDFKGIIDYIFYAKSSMTPLGLLGPVAPEWLKENKIIGCPHPHVPSGNLIPGIDRKG